MTVFPWDATLPPLPRLWAAVELRTVTDWLLGEAMANAIARVLHTVAVVL